MISGQICTISDTQFDTRLNWWHISSFIYNPHRLQWYWQNRVMSTWGRVFIKLIIANIFILHDISASILVFLEWLTLLGVVQYCSTYPITHKLNTPMLFKSKHIHYRITITISNWSTLPHWTRFFSHFELSALIFGRGTVSYVTHDPSVLSVSDRAKMYLYSNPRTYVSWIHIHIELTFLPTHILQVKYSYEIFCIILASARQSIPLGILPMCSYAGSTKLAKCYQF